MLYALHKNTSPQVPRASPGRSAATAATASRHCLAPIGIVRQLPAMPYPALRSLLRSRGLLSVLVFGQNEEADDRILSPHPIAIISQDLNSELVVWNHLPVSKTIEDVQK